MIIYNFVTAECTIPKLDVIFVLDTSKSINNEKNFGIMKDFIKDTTDVMNINLNDSLAAVVLFARKATIRFSLTEHTNKNNFQQAVDNIKYDEVKQTGTNIPSALNLLRIAGQDGRLALRNGTVKVAVLITDGRPNLRHLNILNSQAKAGTKKAATRLHNSGIYDQVYSIGVEEHRAIGKVLKDIANPPSLVFSITGFNTTLFQELTRKLTLSFCNGK